MSKDTAMDEWREKNPLKIWLKKAPKERMDQVCEKMGVGRRTIYAYMEGANLPRADDLQDLCDHIKVPLRKYVSWWRLNPCRKQAAAVSR